MCSSRYYNGIQGARNYLNCLHKLRQKCQHPSSITFNISIDFRLHT